MRVGGVYQIVAPDGRFYIGSSRYVKQRWSHHRGALRNGKHGSRKLQEVADTYGVDALVFELLACCIDPESLPTLEQQFLDKHKPPLNTFRNARVAMHDDATREKAKRAIRESVAHSAARLGNQALAARGVARRIVKLTDDSVFESSYQAARECGVSHVDSVATAANKGWRCGGHYWAWEGSGVTLADREQAAAEREAERRTKSAQSMTETTRRPVRRESDGAVFPSIAEAARQCRCHHNAIHRSIKTGMRAQGSRWSYAPR